MTERYHVEAMFKEDGLTDEEYEGILKEIESHGDEVEIEKRKDSLQYVAHDAASSAVALTVGQLIVSSGDALLSLYQLIRSHPAYFAAYIRTDEGNRVEPMTEERMEQYSINKNNGVVIGKVEEDLNVEGDVYLVAPSWMDKPEEK